MIDFGLNDEQRELKALAQDFAKERIRPLNRDAEKGGVPEALKREAFEVGFSRMALPEGLDGLNLGYLEQALVLEELAWGDAGIAPMLLGSGFAGLAIKELASEPQKEQFLAPFAKPENFDRCWGRSPGPSRRPGSILKPPRFTKKTGSSTAKKASFGPVRQAFTSFWATTAPGFSKGRQKPNPPKHAWASWLPLQDG